MKKVRVTHSLINKWIEYDEILTYCYFIKLKYLYSNSTIYNFSLRKAAILIGVSPNSIKSHLRKMEKMEIIKIKKNKNGKTNITFTSIKKISRIYGIKHDNKCGSIEFHASESVQVIKTRLYSKVLLNNLNKQKYIIKGKTNSLMRKVDKLKKIKSNDSEYHSLQKSIASERINLDVSICSQTVGNMFHKTKMTGYNQLKKIARMGIVTLNKRIVPVLRNCTRDKFEYYCTHGEMFKGKFFYSSKESSIMKNAGFIVTVL